jgi:hypothetical protein
LFVSAAAKQSCNDMGRPGGRFVWADAAAAVAAASKMAPIFFM